MKNFWLQKSVQCKKYCVIEDDGTLTNVPVFNYLFNDKIYYDLCVCHSVHNDFIMCCATTTEKLFQLVAQILEQYGTKICEIASNDKKYLFWLKK